MRLPTVVLPGLVALAAAWTGMTVQAARTRAHGASPAPLWASDITAWGLPLACLIAGCLLGAGLWMRWRARLAALDQALTSAAGRSSGTEPGTATTDPVGYLESTHSQALAGLAAALGLAEADRDRLAALTSGLRSGILAIDGDETVGLVNEAARHLLDLGDDLVGKRLWEVTRNPEIKRLVDTIQRSHRPAQGEWRRSGSNRDRVIAIAATPLAPLAPGNAAGAGAVFLIDDISEQRHLESIRREFVANVSHELKTPLTAIHGFAETILDDSAMPQDTQRRFVQRIREASERLEALVQDLLALSRAEDRLPRSRREPVDLRALVKESASHLAAHAERRRQAFSVDLPEHGLEIQGDHEALRRAIENLITNAIAYTPEGGLVAVRLFGEGDEAVIEVEDDGIGIAAHDQERIFERFFRVDKARSRASGGTGLGLSIVKHVALAHGGRVEVCSSPGEGSTFTLLFPYRPPPSM